MASSADKSDHMRPSELCLLRAAIAQKKTDPEITPSGNKKRAAITREDCAGISRKTCFKTRFDLANNRPMAFEVHFIEVGARVESDSARNFRTVLSFVITARCVLATGIAWPAFQRSWAMTAAVSPFTVASPSFEFALQTRTVIRMRSDFELVSWEWINRSKCCHRSWV